MNRWLYAVPVVALIAFGGLGLMQLLTPEKPGFERVSRQAPTRSFDTLGGGAMSYVPTPNGKPIAVNLFASWCGPCAAEHPYLVALSARHPGQVYGLLYKDTPENGDIFLARLGNPYTEVSLDPDGAGGLDFGLTGVPETFVISPEGEILLHIAGPLDETTAKQVSDLL